MAAQQVTIPISSNGKSKNNINYHELRKVAVIIETRINPSLEFVVRNAIYHLPNWGIQIHHSTGFYSNEMYIKTALKDLG